MKLANFFLPICFSLTAQAQFFQIGETQYAGNGCPQGTLSILNSLDNLSQHVTTDQYFAITHPVNQKVLDRKSCNLAIPVDVSPGYQVALTGELEGFVEALQKNQASVSVEVFFAGQRGPRTTKTFRQQSQSFQVQFPEALNQKLLWSTCGQSVIARLNTSVLAQNKNAFIGIEQLNLRFLVRRCQ